VTGAPSVRLAVALVANLPAVVAAQAVGAASVAPVVRSLTLDVGGFDATLRRPQEANGSVMGRASARGSAVVGPWTTIASASWMRRRDRGLEWTAVSDAVDQAPFVWADSIGGPWQRDVVRLAASGARSFGAVWSFGMAGDYAVSQGARDNDPRPLYRRLSLVAEPWVGRRFGPHRVTIGLRYLRDREDQEYGFFSNQFPALFRIRGIGTVERTQLNTAERAVLAQGGGGRLGLDLGQGATQWLLGVEGELLSDRRRDGIADPVEGGTRTIRRVGGGLAYRRVQAEGGWRFDMAGRALRIEGVDPVFRAINARIARDSGSASLAWWRGDSADARWQGHVRVGVQREMQRDILADAVWSATLPVAMVALGRGWRRAPGRLGVILSGHWTGQGTGRALAGLGGAIFEAVAARDYAWARAAPAGGMVRLTWDPARAWLGVAGIDVAAAAIYATAGPASRRHDLLLRLRWQ
jgi:hypothetical protein